MPRRKEPRIPDAVLDQLLAGADPKTAFDPNGLIDDLKKALAERVLNAEMDHHLAGEEPGNRRNGYGKKTVITDSGQIELAVPRDREAQSVMPHRGSEEVDRPEDEDIKGRKNQDYFANRKAQSWWALRTRFQKTHRWVTEGQIYPLDDLISISSKIPLHMKLIAELAQPTF